MGIEEGGEGVEGGNWWKGNEIGRGEKKGYKNEN